MTTIPGKLAVGTDGRVTGPASITWNHPFPTGNGSWGSGAMNGVIMHTEVGWDHNVVNEFNQTISQASATFSVRDDGHIHQYGPIGKGWYAWAQEAGNLAWYSIEHEDGGHPEVPLNDAQIASSAQILECLSAYAGFPLQEANHPDERGYGVHYMGGAAWGGHTCPDTGPDHPVRSLQRPAIIGLAKQIRAGVPPPPFPSGIWHADGRWSLAGLASRQGVDVAAIWFETAVTGSARSALIGPLQRPYLNAGQWDAKMPSGMILWLP